MIATFLGAPCINNRLVKDIKIYLLNNTPIKAITIDGKQYYKNVLIK